jgi:hypothetical protein
MKKKIKKLIYWFFDWLSEFYYRNQGEIETAIIICTVFTYFFALIFGVVIASELFEKWWHL